MSSAILYQTTVPVEIEYSAIKKIEMKLIDTVRKAFSHLSRIGVKIFTFLVSGIFLLYRPSNITEKYV